MSEAQETTAWRRAVRDHIATLPKQHEARLEALVRFRRELHEELAIAAQPEINAVLALKDDGYIATRRTLCSWVGERLRSLGLAVRGSTGEPSVLMMNIRGRNDDRGYFRLQHFDSRRSLVRTLSTPETPDLELMPDPPRREGHARTGPADRPELGPCL